MKKFLKNSLVFLLLLILVSASVLPAMADEGSMEIFGTVQYYSAYTSTATIKDGFYYTDEWFSGDPAQRNDELALLSMQFAASTVERSANEATIEFLKKMGFTEYGFEEAFKTDPQSANITWAKKKINVGGEERTLALIAVMGYGSSAAESKNGWSQSFMVNGESAEGEHYAYSVTAGNVVEDIAELGFDDNTIYWLTGHSRGGALVNLAAAHLPEKIPAAAGKIFAYTFEAPLTVDAGLVNPASHSYIHNYICSDDPITLIPPFNMARYGVDFQLDTEATNAKLQENLTAMGAEAAGKVSSYLKGNPVILHILADVSGKINSRGAYSAVNTETVTGINGNEITLTYVYQDMLVKLVGSILSGDFSGFSLNTVLGNSDKAIPALKALVAAVKTGSDALYYEAGCGLKSFLGQIGLAMPLNEAEYYAVCKVLGPYLINESYNPSSEPQDLLSYLPYLNEEVVSLIDYQTAIFSHYYETEIARLKALADVPAMDNIDITITEPAVGDEVSKAPGEIAANAVPEEKEWLNVSARWLTEDETLQDNATHVMEVTVKSEGQPAADSFAMTLNGKNPINPLTITYKDGVTTIVGTYEFIFGDGGKVTISFDAGGHADDPEPVKAMRGLALKETLNPASFEPVKENDLTYYFKGWFDENGTLWEEITPEENMTLHAGWDPFITNIDILVDIPHIGDGVSSPVPAQEGVHFRVKGFALFNSMYEQVEKISDDDDYFLEIYVEPVSADVPFLMKEEDIFDGEEMTHQYTYMGEGTINGEESYGVASGPDTLTLTLQFTPLPEAVTYSCEEGNKNTFTKGSKDDLKFVFKRSTGDETAFSHFTGIKVDGTDVDAANYAAEAGSVNLQIKSAYLETLAEGDHTLTVLFDDGQGEAAFTVAAAEPDDSSTSVSDNDPDDSSSDDSSKDDSSKDDSSKDDSSKDDSSKDDSSKDTSSKSSSSDTSSKSTSSRSTSSKSTSSKSTSSKSTSSKSTSSRSASSRSTSSKSSSSRSSSATSRTSVRTGDSSNIILWVVILLVAVGVLVFMSKDLRNNGKRK